MAQLTDAQQGGFGRLQRLAETDLVLACVSQAGSIAQMIAIQSCFWLRRELRQVANLDLLWLMHQWSPVWLVRRQGWPLQWQWGCIAPGLPSVGTEHTQTDPAFQTH